MTQPESTNWPPPVQEAPTERPHPLTPIVKTWVLLVAVAIFLLREIDFTATLESRMFLPAIIAISAVALVQLVLGLFVWRYTRFVADVDELRVERNFIWHTSDKIPYTKVQSVDVVQPFAARLLGLAKVHLDVGGGGGKDIEFLSRKRAYDLRDYVLARAHGQTVAPTPAEEATTSGPVLQDVHVGDRVLLRTTPRNLVLGTIFSATFFIVLLVSIAIGVFGSSAGGWFAWWPVIVTAAGMIMQAAKSWNNMLIATPAGLKSTRGLTSLASQSLPRTRVQGIHISQGLLWRMFGFYRLQITVLGYGISEDAEGTSNVVVPVGPWSDIQIALNAIWPGFDFAQLQWHGQPDRAKWLTWFGFRHRGWTLDHQVVATRRGVLTRQIDLVPYARMQSLRIAQGPLRRKLHLAAVEVHLSTGPVNAELGYLDEQAARDLAWKLADLGRWARSADLELSELLDLEPPSQQGIETPPPASVRQGGQ